VPDDRTQAPTRRRRQEARDRGQVARSPDLTAAAGLLAAAVLIGALGDDLARALIGLTRGALDPASIAASATPAEVVDRLRGAAWAVLGPLLGMLLGIAATMIVVHQVQVGGLWSPGLLAPDVARLISGGGGLAARGGRGLWSLAKAAVLVVVAAAVLDAERPALAGLAAADPPALASGAAAILLRAARWLAAAMLGLGAVDFALCWNRVEAALRQTPDEYREDLRAADGDPALRSRRRKLAQEWRRDAAGVLPGAKVLLAGSNGLVVLLGGGPPPGRVTVRQVARGPAAAVLRREARAAGVPEVEAPELARHFARGRSAGPTLPPALADRLAAAWPTA
jgi:flagellar biosynthetic protein FlhB